jgi:arabinoxylan arabinofuranohydrolase
MTKGSTAGFKSFSNLGMRKRPSGLRIWTRGYGSGVFEVRTKWNGKVLAEIPVGFSNVWKSYATDVKFVDDVFDLFLTFNGEGSLALLSFAFE